MQDAVLLRVFFNRKDQGIILKDIFCLSTAFWLLRCMIILSGRSYFKLMRIEIVQKKPAKFFLADFF
jgi:hypothetical protein